MFFTNLERDGSPTPSRKSNPTVKSEKEETWPEGGPWSPSVVTLTYRVTDPGMWLPLEVENLCVLLKAALWIWNSLRVKLKLHLDPQTPKMGPNTA